MAIRRPRSRARGTTCCRRSRRRRGQGRSAVSWRAGGGTARAAGTALGRGAQRGRPGRAARRRRASTRQTSWPVRLHSRCSPTGRLLPRAGRGRQSGTRAEQPHRGRRRQRRRRRRVLPRRATTRRRRRRTGAPSPRRAEVRRRETALPRKPLHDFSLRVCGGTAPVRSFRSPLRAVHSDPQEYIDCASAYAYGARGALRSDLLACVRIEPCVTKVVRAKPTL